jgi:hypothetical protein
MFDQAPSGRSGGRITVWPFYALAVLAGVLGLVLVIAWWPEDYPEEDELVKVSGRIASVRVRDDLSNSGAGAMMPAMTSTYFTLEGVAGEFRYPSSQPGYPIVRDRTAYAIDVWVERDRLGDGEPLRIWQIRENNPHNLLGEETFIGRDEIVERLSAVDRSMVKAGSWLLAIAAGLALLGAGAGRWNRRRAKAKA